jgi:predicted nucleic acid-binding protein
VSAQVDWVVSGDDDLLVLHSYASIPILSANQALRQLGLLA